MLSDEISKCRPLLADRIQLTITPRLPYDPDVPDCLKAFSESIFPCFKRFFSLDMLKSTGMKKFQGFRDDGKRYAYFALDDFLKDVSWMRYCSHVRVSANFPYSITMEFNFIRYVRSHYDGLGLLDHDYDSRVIVHADNFINYQDCPSLDSVVLNDLRIKAPDDIRSFCNHIWSYFLDGSDLCLEAKGISMNYIEFNREFYVGDDFSLDVLTQFQDFVYSAKGRAFMQGLGSLGVNVYNADAKTAKNLSSFSSDESQTIRFMMGKGLSFKVYRKTKDHVRVEIGFSKSFIRRKCGTSSFVPVYVGNKGFWVEPRKEMRDIAQDIFSRLDFPALIANIMSGSKVDYDLLHDAYEFADSVFPGFGTVISHVVNGVAVSDHESVSFIRKHPFLLSRFARVYKNGCYGYVYDPDYLIRKDFLIPDCSKDSPEDSFLEHYRRMEALSMDKTMGYLKKPVTLVAADSRPIVDDSVVSKRVVGERRKWKKWRADYERAGYIVDKQRVDAIKKDS